MKNLPLLSVLVLLICSCEESAVMGYDETKNDSILELEITKSPEENVASFLSNENVEALDMQIYASPAKDCECAKNGKNCYCLLSNEGLGEHSCNDAAELCKKSKFIEVEVHSDDIEALEALGFELSDG